MNACNDITEQAINCYKWTEMAVQNGCVGCMLGIANYCIGELRFQFADLPGLCYAISVKWKNSVCLSFDPTAVTHWTYTNLNCLK